ncbi:protein of unknown function DUF1684 [Fibrella aestuarina BUZ 2]|uniref:DUF1684 domain-containing protein n=1 Tax=Fibrella aestuarina BUZ 2 TaxID=1166018 RepID=I0KBA2_9BACT|nr:DUF1684 domain-containing protein [Fibrella aestuarina]CCH01405.1 protein of unknown function DUF1684 [Fibrella aestuarina BUZ 2]
MDEMIIETGPVNPYARTFFWFWGLACLALIGFRSDEPTYRQRLDVWHQQRLESLRSETGWLNLAGLFWLKEGANEAGADLGNDLTFPADRASAQLGTFRLVKGTVQFEAAPGATVLADGEPVLATKTIFSPDLTKPVTLSHGSLRWFVIKRGDRYAVRLRDLASPLLKAFTGIERFPADESWRVTAHLERPTAPRTIPILDVTGQTSQQPLAGTLVFEHQGKTYRLDAVREGDRKLFILFGDQTNTHDTYGSGRFLYADLPDEQGNVTLDFNQSINPPCAFTPFATCPLPPQQNRLATAVRAGEKRYGNH